MFKYSLPVWFNFYVKLPDFFCIFIFTVCVCLPTCNLKYGYAFYVVCTHSVTCLDKTQELNVICMLRKHLHVIFMTVVNLILQLPEIQQEIQMDLQGSITWTFWEMYWKGLILTVTLSEQELVLEVVMANIRWVREPGPYQCKHRCWKYSLQYLDKEMTKWCL